MKSRRKILAIDDDRQALDLIEAMLAPHGYEVITAESGEEVIALASKVKPALILLDVMMPRMDGYATLAKLKEDKITTNIPVVMVSAVGYELNQKLATQLGAVGYITKPVALMELQGTIAQLLKNTK
jgi:CheY-like chemotaxis protein